MKFSFISLQSNGTENKFSDLPDLILVDGGPQQLRFALEALRELGVEL